MVDRTNVAADSLGRYCRKIYRLILAAGSKGHICEEIVELTGLPHQTVSARLVDLRDKGLVWREGDTRQTSRKRSAMIHTIKPQKKAEA